MECLLFEGYLVTRSWFFMEKSDPKRTCQTIKKQMKTDLDWLRKRFGIKDSITEINHFHKRGFAKEYFSN